ncbi:AraC family transcriptional regulator [Acidisoma cellulosilytica]|uniref:AraC family transcriptional regulator n=1 Tax=Acidisoma cellulosilyticum TaxID=2802395 RepID=A0A964E4W9_9PROT|nr:AraC family transcriptional regulator [Acidisoma cellulosilyticum]MCB8881807.1 AraC family transcriptional regulator [Acidisoma cellulosilyticum]
MEEASFKRPFELRPIETLSARYVQRSFKPHAHEEYLLGIITAGAHSVWCRGEHHCVSGGTIVTMHPGDVHHGGAGDAEGWSQRMLYIGEDELRALLGVGASSPSFRTSFHHSPDLAGRLARLHDMVHRSPLAMPRDTALTGLATLLRPMVGAIGSPPERRDLPDARVQRMIDFLHAHAAEDIGLDALGALAGLGQRHTIDVFKRRVGLPPHAYHLGLKVRMVQKLLRQGVTPAQAAADAGFADQSHMTRHFIAIVGTTPAAFVRA